MALIFMNLIAAGVIARYEHAISQVVALVFFMPLDHRMRRQRRLKPLHWSSAISLPETPITTMFSD